MPCLTAQRTLRGTTGVGWNYQAAGCVCRGSLGCSAIISGGVVISPRAALPADKLYSAISVPAFFKRGLLSGAQCACQSASLRCNTSPSWGARRARRRPAPVPALRQADHPWGRASAGSLGAARRTGKPPNTTPLPADPTQESRFTPGRSRRDTPIGRGKPMGRNGHRPRPPPSPLSGLAVAWCPVPQINANRTASFTPGLRCKSSRWHWLSLRFAPCPGAKSIGSIFAIYSRDRTLAHTRADGQTLPGLAAGAPGSAAMALQVARAPFRPRIDCPKP